MTALVGISRRSPARRGPATGRAASIADVGATDEELDEDDDEEEDTRSWREKVARSSKAKEKFEEEEAAKPKPIMQKIYTSPVPPKVEGPFDPAKQIGVTDPLGYFDPLGFCKLGDEESFRKYRIYELKHGRVAMMAAAGAVVQYYVRLPIVFDFVPSGIKAPIDDGNGRYGFAILLGLSFVLETTLWKESDDREPGDYGDPLGFGLYDIDTRNKELNNGRAGMIAAAGIIAAELLTGKSAMETFGLPPSAWETGLAQA